MITNDRWTKINYFFLQESMELSLTVLHSDLISTVNYPNKTISCFKVVSPIRSEWFLPSNIPYIQLITKSSYENKCRFKRDQKTKWQAFTFYALRFLCWNQELARLCRCLRHCIASKLLSFQHCQVHFKMRFKIYKSQIERTEVTYSKKGTYNLCW